MHLPPLGAAEGVSGRCTTLLRGRGTLVAGGSTLSEARFGLLLSLRPGLQPGLLFKTR